MKMMKAVRINQCGDYDVLEYGDYPMPELGADQVLVKVISTSVSGWDIKYRDGSILKKLETGNGLPGRKACPLPQQLGREATGVVVAVGDSITQYQPGDHVLGLVHPENPYDINTIRGLGNLSAGIDYPGHVMKGGNAQYIARPEHYWMQIPKGVDLQLAAAGSWSYPTSHRIVAERCQIKMGDVAFITGASGGMGFAALQWAKLVGALVITSSRDVNKRARLMELGADLVVDPGDLETTKQAIMSFTKDQGVEHVIEFTGSLTLLKLGYEVLRLGGKICPVGGDQSVDHLPFGIMDLVAKEATVVGIRGSRRNDQRVYLTMLAAGKIKPLVATVLPLREIKKAHELVQTHQVVGKVMLDPWVS